MPAPEFLATSANNKSVYYDPIGSHTATHFADAPQLKALSQEVIARTVLDTERILFDVDMGRTVGNTDEVENDEGDVVVFAKRLNRSAYTSFNKSKTSQPCSLVSVVFIKNPDDSYELTSAWIGSANSPSFPGEPDETPDSKPYWLHHSLVWGSQEVQPDTETSVCPW